MAVTAAQTLFAVALTAIAVGVVVFAAYVFSSPHWASRWYPRRRDRR